MAEPRREFSWSKSRDSQFKECKRAYFLNYYAAWGSWKPGMPEELRELYIMKSLNNQASWTGILVHEVAELALRALLAGTPLSLEEALHNTEERLRQELEISQNGTYRVGANISWGGRLVPVNGLQEFYYQMPVADSEWEAIVASALGCVRTLYDSPSYRRLSAMDTGDILSVEDLKSFYVGDVRVWVKLDLAVRGLDGGVVIVDWKTGRSHRAQDVALQLGIYGLFGREFWQIPASGLKGYDVNLRDGTARTHTLDDRTLNFVTGYVMRSAAEMKGHLDSAEENLASPDRFPKTDKTYFCRRCKFRRACDRE